MKNEKLFRCIIAAIAALIVLAAAMIAVSYYAPYRYIKSCLYSNKDVFKQIPVCLKNSYTEGDTNIKINADSEHDEIKSLLNGLRDQYQKDSEFPVFSYVDAYFDSDGDVLLYIRAKMERIKSGDGKESPDRRCYELVYIDEDYDGNQPVKDTEPFWGNWHIWSHDTYSG